MTMASDCLNVIRNIIKMTRCAYIMILQDFHERSESFEWPDTHVKVGSLIGRLIILLRMHILLLSVAQLVRFFVVKSIHLSLGPRLSTGAPIFLNLFHNLTGVVFLVLDDVLVDSEAHMVISSIFSICRLSLS